MPGIVPAPVSFSDLRVMEHYTPGAKVGSGLATVQVERSLNFRRLYCYVFAQATATAALLYGNIGVFNRGSKTGELPFFAAQNNPVPKALYSPFVIGGYPAGNSLILQSPFFNLIPATAFSAAESISSVLQPFEITGECDAFDISITQAFNLGAARIAFIATSSRQ